MLELRRFLAEEGDAEGVDPYGVRARGDRVQLLDILHRAGGGPPSRQNAA